MWLDPDRLVWLWAPVENGQPVGIVEVQVCPHCHAPLPNVAANVLKALQREPLAEPEE